MEGVIWLSLGGGKELHLQTIDGDNITQYITTHFALTVNDFDSFYKQLVSMEVKYFDYFGTESKISVRPNGVKKTYVKDPDENWVEVIGIIK